jgi:hypothetical protein
MAGLTGFKSRGVDVSSYAPVLAGDGLVRLTGIGIPSNSTSLNLAGLFTLYVATSGPLTAFVPTYWEMENLDFNGVSRKTMKVDPNGNMGIGVGTDNIANSDRLNVRDGNIRLSSSTFSGGIIFPDGTSMTTASAGPVVTTLASMELLGSTAGSLISVSDASAPYSYCVSTGAVSGSWVLMNTTTHCQ